MVFSYNFLFSVEVNKVVIWGHKLHTHTHSYIHYGFYKAFKHLGYKTLWLDNTSDISNLDLSQTLFITEHQVDQCIPLREDCYYVVHCSSDAKYDHIKEIDHYVDLKVYKNIFLHSATLMQVEPYIYYDLPNQTLIMPWATDLLPEEIEQNKKLTPLLKLKPVLRNKKIYWVGTLGGGKFGNHLELGGFIRACKQQHIPFIHSDPWASPVSAEDNQRLIQRSYLAPTICGGMQLQHDYIPCRIFKNISYGHIGVTNSKAVYNLFNKKIVYNPDTFQLFFDAQAKLMEGNVEEFYELMDFVKEKHTYLNRIQHILNFIALLEHHPD
ncbi:MAG: hypothetical protein HY860_06905 [Chlamydiales bacterium]|nr:hypothetical protein [Chlamydiales bacterium]